MTKLKVHMPHTVLSFVQVGDSGVAMCHLPDDNVTPFVNWRVDAEGNAYLGHYFVREADCRADYHKRAGLAL